MYLSLTLYGKQRNFPRTKRQRRFRELSTDETTEKKNTKQKQKMPYRQRQKSQTIINYYYYYFLLLLLLGNPKFPYEFKEIRSLILPYVELIM